MAEIKTKSGFKVVIKEDAMNNWELLEAFREIDKGKTGAIVDVAPLLLGEEQFAKLKDHLRDENGVVKVSDMVEEIHDIIQGADETKKS